ncbi:hypothetical protein KC19_VG283900 [Ceratodon purpureus]|uniref:Uncharacterized protein n=1 Tax=Ceratodon purpureus TaxID=3225 RepID=A0A8T0HUP4_CERPU|nr:hypothetical protein KC19_VG283900 [Ceratodon purpureus]
MEGSEKFRAKSEQMKYANACRRSKGRTGPLGEVGIRERLRHRLNRSPAPEEVVAEMTRDKGYSGARKSIRHGRSSPSESEATDSSLPFLRTEPSCEPEHPPPLPTVQDGVQPAQPFESSPPSAEAAIDTIYESTTTPVSVALALNPVFALITKQIADVQNSAVGSTEDGRALIATPESQLSTLRQRKQTVSENVSSPVTESADLLVGPMPGPTLHADAVPEQDHTVPSSRKGAAKPVSQSIPARPLVATRKSLWAASHCG